MRLTLRTLLAYLDGILDPKDHEELAKQVETSDNAKELIHRTGDTVRRIRLGAPSLESTSHNANAVAEYLDNTMSPEDVVEFERRCLESDAELAEAASCHHILKMVLAERVEVDTDLRRVMYGLPARHAAEQRANPVIERPDTPPPAAAAGPVRVPDYLRSSPSTFFWRLAPAIGAVALLGVAAWVFRPGGLYDQAKRQGQAPGGAGDGTPSQVARVDTAAGESGERPLVDPADPAAGVEPGPDVAAQPAAPGGEQTSPQTGDAQATSSPVEGWSDPAGADAPLKGPGEASPDIGDVDGGDVGGAASSAIGAAAADSGSSPPPSVPQAEARSSSGVTPPIDPETAPPPDGPVPAGPLDDAPGSVASGGEAAGPETPPSASADDEPAAPVEIGMVSTPREVLLRYDEAAGVWRRLAFDEAGAPPSVFAGDRVLSLPYFRPVVAIKGINANLSGAALVEVDRSGDASSGVALRLVYGRVVLQNTGGGPASIELRAGGRGGIATLQRGAVLAVEAERPFVPGRDPTVDPAPLVASYYAPTDGVAWRSGDDEFVLTTGSTWREVDGRAGPVSPLAEPIDWLVAEPLSNIQQQAAAEMAQTLVPEEPIWPQLQVLKNARRIEQQALAAIASMHVGHYGPSIRALGDGEQRSVWSQEIEALRATMSRSPELARAVREALSNERDPRHVDDLYQLLCGFTPEQVGLTPDQRRSGVLRRLVDWLSSDQLDYRVLANYNLEQITGRRGVFNPVGLVRSRESTIARLRNRLEDDQLINRSER